MRGRVAFRTPMYMCLYVYSIYICLAGRHTRNGGKKTARYKALCVNTIPFARRVPCRVHFQFLSFGKMRRASTQLDGLCSSVSDRALLRAIRRGAGRIYSDHLSPNCAMCSTSSSLSPSSSYMHLPTKCGAVSRLYMYIPFAYIYTPLAAALTTARL